MRKIEFEKGKPISKNDLELLEKIGFKKLTKEQIEYIKQHKERI